MQETLAGFSTVMMWLVLLLSLVAVVLLGISIGPLPTEHGHALCWVAVMALIVVLVASPPVH